MTPKKFEYDVFISHAVEDKIGIANELNARLRVEGLRVWYSGSELSAGDSISNAIQEGLEKSRFGIVILSKNYLEKNWPIREYFMLKAKERPDNKVLLPVLYGITPKDLLFKDLNMADQFSIHADRGMDWVVEKILAAIRKERVAGKVIQVRKWITFAAVAALLLLAMWLIQFLSHQNVPHATEVEAIIQKRIHQFQQEIESTYVDQLKNSGATVKSITSIDSIYRLFNTAQSNYRNEYEFYNGITRLRSKKHVQAETGIDLDYFALNSYQIDSPTIYYLKSTNEEGQTVVRYAYVATQAARYAFSSPAELSEDSFAVAVNFENPLRYVEISLTFPVDMRDIKRKQVRILGFKSSETYILNRKNGDWIVADSR